MNPPTPPGKLSCIVLTILLGAFFCFADQTHTNKFVKVLIANPVKTNFVADGQLTKKEINQVLELARQCGILQASEVRTFHYLPSIEKGISVKSVERIDDRNTSFDTAYIINTNWKIAFEPKKGAKHIGSFWLSGEKYTTLLRSYQSTSQQPFQVSIEEGVDLAIADKMVGLSIAGKLPFSETKNDSHAVFTIPEKPNDLKPKSIRKGDSKNTYEVEFQTQRVFEYKFEKGQFIYIGDYEYVI